MGHAARWLETAQTGHCGVASVGGSCSNDTKGAWQLQSSVVKLQQAVSECLVLCKSCERCSYISVSLKHHDCSWFSECSLGGLLSIVDGFFSGPGRGVRGGGRRRNVTRSKWAAAPGMSALFGRQPPRTDTLVTSLPTDRFVPSTFEEAMASVYTMWNLLDQLIFNERNVTQQNLSNEL
jgi:hypothetical protein